jgi:hypothetical protein
MLTGNLHRLTRQHPTTKGSNTQEFPPLTKWAVCNNSLLLMPKDPNSLFLERSKPLHLVSPFLLTSRVFNLSKDSPFSPM